MLKARRKELGITQRDMAKRVGITNVYLCWLETGKCHVNTYDLTRKLAKAYDIDPMILAQTALLENL